MHEQEGQLINIIEMEATLGDGPVMRGDKMVKRHYIKNNEVKAVRIQMKTYCIQTAARSRSPCGQL